MFPDFSPHRVPLSVEKDEPLRSEDVCVFRPDAVMQPPGRLANLIEHPKHDIKIRENQCNPGLIIARCVADRDNFQTFGMIWLIGRNTIRPFITRMLVRRPELVMCGGRTEAGDSQDLPQTRSCCRRWLGLFYNFTRPLANVHRRLKSRPNLQVRGPPRWWPFARRAPCAIRAAGTQPPSHGARVQRQQTEPEPACSPTRTVT